MASLTRDWWLRAWDQLHEVDPWRRAWGEGAQAYIRGTRGDDNLVGTGEDDLIEGRKGHDTLYGGAGADTLVGSTGDDSYFVDNTLDQAVEKRDGGTDTVVATVDWTLGKHVENLTLNGTPSDRLRGIGNALDNVIQGDIGQNFIDGGDGNDTIDGGQALSPGTADTLIGGEGDDDITASAGGFEGDLLYGGTGNDTLRGPSATLYGEDGDDLLIGGPGWGHHASGNALYGGTGNDTLQGGGYLNGGDGNDLMDTRYGTSVEAGLGNDTLTGSGAAGWVSYFIDMGEGDDLVDVMGTNNLLSIEGGAGHDQLTGYGNNGLQIDGGAGDDTIRGTTGPGSPAYLLQGGDGNDELVGMGRSGTLEGGGGDDHLRSLVFDGSFSFSSLLGGAGNDTLEGGTGRSSLEGGEGEDAFVLLAREILPSDATWVMDFEAGRDSLRVSQTTLPVGNGDLLVDGATTITGPGGFDAGAELVILAADVLDPLTLGSVAAALGEANQAYATGQSAVFVVGNGSETWVLRFESAGNDATISAAELSLIGHLAGGVKPAAEDIAWGP